MNDTDFRSLKWDHNWIFGFSAVTLFLTFLILVVLTDRADKIDKRIDALMHPQYRIEGKTLYAPDDLYNWEDSALHKGKTIRIRHISELKEGK